VLIPELIVGGLRAYGPEPITVDLAPLTLVFGPNSAGKSSLLSVLPLLQQTARHPEVLSMSGDLVEGGTFRMAVHNHDESLPITLGFGWDGGLVRSVYRWSAKRRAAVKDDAGALDADALRILSQVYFLGPMRARAERTTAVGLGGDLYVGPAGEDMAALLFDRPDLLTAVNDWCERLGLGYRIQMLTPVSHDIVISAGDFTVLALEDIRHDPPVLVSPRAVGYGVGQLLPVITQCCLSEGGAIIVEQPEVHLHPRLQSAVADLFIETVASGRGQILVETHSEHLVLRLLRRIREGMFSPDLLRLLYVDLHADGGAFVRELEVDHRGELVDGWPGDFFEERLAEVLPGLR
jgi:hypothetical protein